MKRPLRDAQQDIACASRATQGRGSVAHRHRAGGPRFRVVFYMDMVIEPFIVRRAWIVGKKLAFNIVVRPQAFLQRITKRLLVLVALVVTSNIDSLAIIVPRIRGLSTFRDGTTVRSWSPRPSVFRVIPRREYGLRCSLFVDLILNATERACNLGFQAIGVASILLAQTVLVSGVKVVWQTSITLGAWLFPVPSRSQDTHTTISADQPTVGGDGHRPDDFPFAGIVIEAPQCAAGPGHSAPYIRETGGHGHVKITRTIRLHRNDDGKQKARWKLPRKSIRLNGRDPDHSTTLPSVGEE